MVLRRLVGGRRCRLNHALSCVFSVYMYVCFTLCVMNVSNYLQRNEIKVGAHTFRMISLHYKLILNTSTMKQRYYLFFFKIDYYFVGSECFIKKLLHIFGSN